MDKSENFEQPTRQKKSGKSFCVAGLIILFVLLIILVGSLFYFYSVAKKIQRGEIDSGFLFFM